MAKQSAQARLSFSLSLEELALCLGLINRPDLGRALIMDIYPELDEERIDERLTAASHSLLAHGLCGLAESGAAVLDADLERAVFPLAKFDHLLQVSMTNPQAQVSARIHAIRNVSFTAHMVDIGIVHILEHGSARDLTGYVRELFAEFSRAIAIRKQDSFEHPVTLGVLGRAVEAGDQAGQIAVMLQQDGWSRDWADRLSADLARQEARATLVLVEANSEMDTEKARSAPQRTLLLLQGVDRCWAFEFSGSGDEARGAARVLNQKLLGQMLDKFATI